MSVNAVVPKVKNVNEVIVTRAFDVPWFIFLLYETGRFLRKLVRDVGTDSRNLKGRVLECSELN